jgi:hypothetical protein
MAGRELEEEIEALARGRPHRDRLKELMNKKELVRRVVSLAGWLRCAGLCV